MSVLAVIVIAGAVIYFTMGKSATINVPTPPGWEPADEKAVANFEESSPKGQNFKVDCMFSDGTLANTIVIYHGKGYIMDAPDSESYEDMKKFFEKHEDEYMDQLKSSYEAYGVSWKINDKEIVEMNSGISAIHLGLTAQGQGVSVTQDLMIFYRNDMEYAVLINKLGNESNEEEIDFLMKNISFK